MTYSQSKDISILPDYKDLVLVSNPFSGELHKQMPGLIRDGCNILENTVEKDVFLISSLGVLSSIIPNVFGIYDGVIVGPNLFVYLLGRYGSGKGAMRYGRKLGELIHKKKVERNVESRAQFDQQQRDYNEQSKQHRKGEVEMPIRPLEPKTELLFIPANNSKSGVIGLLEDNNGEGLIYESEGDTLADAVKQDYGNFSDVLRKGFHHESVALFRRGGKEHIEIDRPRFSVVVSSTFDQLTNLMPTAENGLFSRFIYYELENNHSFHNVFDERKTHYETQFNALAEQALLMYDKLSDRETPVTFSLTTQQEDQFVEFFKSCKDHICTNEDPDLNGTVNCLGLIAFRIAMILTVVRSLETGQIYDHTTCTDEDFISAIAIIEHLIPTVLSVFFRLPKKQARAAFVNRQQDKADQMKQAEDLKKQGWSNRRIAREIGVNEGTIRNWLAEKAKARRSKISY